jgi:hypothetical protein
MYPSFEDDMKNNLDTIFDKKFIKISSMNYIIDNIPKRGLTNDNIDYRIFHHLFPKFEESTEKMVCLYLSDPQINYGPSEGLSQKNNILYEYKSEINQRLYDMLIPFNSNKFI